MKPANPKPPGIRAVIKVSERTARLLKLLSALGDKTQIEIADESIVEYAERRREMFKKHMAGGRR